MENISAAQAEDALTSVLGLHLMGKLLSVSDSMTFNGVTICSLDFPAALRLAASVMDKTLLESFLHSANVDFSEVDMVLPILHAFLAKVANLVKPPATKIPKKTASSSTATAGSEEADAANILLEISKRPDGTLLSHIDQHALKVSSLSNEKFMCYTDGSLLKSGSNVWAGAGVFWDNLLFPHLSVHVPGKQTNQRAELFAGVCALRQVSNSSLSNSIFVINTDSSYLISGVNSWWLKNNLSDKDLLHGDLWRELNNIIKFLFKRAILVEFIKVKAHSGIQGNEEADKLAKKAATSFSLLTT